MTTKEINQSIQSMKIQLTTGEKIEYWINFIFLLIPLSFFGLITVYEPLSNGEVPTFGIITVIAFFLFLRHKLVSPKLDVYKSSLTKEQFKQANQAAAALNGWFILSNRKNYFSAIKGTNWQWDGIKITAILENEKLYLNSMVNPSTRSNPFTFGLNKKNKLALIRQYQLSLKGENTIQIVNKIKKEREEEFWKESEWTLNNTLKRVIGYSLSISFIAMGVWMITTCELNGVAIGIVLISLCSSYVYQDISVIRKKRKKSKI